MEVGDIYSEGRYGDVEVLELLPKSKAKIKFLNTGYICERAMHSIKVGAVGDPYCPRVSGVGYIGEGAYKSRSSPPEGKKYPQYRCWENMLYRTYDTKHRLANRYEGRGVEVCSEWHDYQVFAAWFDDNYIDGYVLDKDITCPGSLIYSPETCSFIPQEINKFFAGMNERRGDYPIGVYRFKKDGKHLAARISFRDEVIARYDFTTPESAFEFYKEHKERCLKEMAQEYYDDEKISKEVYINLMQWEAVPYPD